MEVINGLKNVKALGANRSYVECAVVGLVDIVASTKISNAVDLATDWDIKQGFLEAATVRANENGILMLNHTGDGFLFMVKENSKEVMNSNLQRFHKMLVADFRQILVAAGSQIAHIESGLRFGISAGPVILGWLGNSNQFSVVGPDVNLAARLCSVASINEMVLSDSAAQIMTVIRNVKAAQHRVYTSLKGFDHGVCAVHVSEKALSQVAASVVSTPVSSQIAMVRSTAASTPGQQVVLAASRFEAKRSRQAGHFGKVIKRYFNSASIRDKRGGPHLSVESFRVAG